MALNCTGIAPRLTASVAAALLAPAFAACSVGTWTDDFAPERCKLQDDVIVMSCIDKENSGMCGMRLSEHSDTVGAGQFSMKLQAAPGKGAVTSFYLSDSQPLIKIGFDIFGAAVKPQNSQIWISLFSGLHGEYNRVINVPFDTTADFHTYMLDLTPTTIRYLVDGVIYHTLDISAWGEAKSFIESSSLRRHISLWGQTVADTQVNCEQFAGMQGKLNDNVNLFPVHASFKPQWNRATSHLSAMSTVSPSSTITATLPHSMNAAKVTPTPTQLASTALVTKVVERQMQQRQQQRHADVEGSSITVPDNLTTTSSAHGDVQPRRTEAVSLSTAVVPVTTAATAAATTTSSFTAVGVPGKATPAATATIAASTDAATRITARQPTMEVAVTAVVDSSMTAAATQAASTIPLPRATAETLPAGTDGAATAPVETAVSTGSQRLDSTPATLASAVAVATTVEGTTTDLPSASEGTITMPAMLLDDQTEVAIDDLQRLAFNSAVDTTATSIPVVLGVVGVVASLLGAFLVWIKLWSHWRLCNQTLEEPRCCILDPELLA